MNFEIIYKSPLDKDRNKMCIMQGVDAIPTISDTVKRVKEALRIQRVPTYRLDANSIVSVTEIAWLILYLS